MMQPCHGSFQNSLNGLALSFGVTRSVLDVGMTKPQL